MPFVLHAIKDITYGFAVCCSGKPFLEFAPDTRICIDTHCNPHIYKQSSTYSVHAVQKYYFRLVNVHMPIQINFTCGHTL